MMAVFGRAMVTDWHRLGSNIAQLNAIWPFTPDLLSQEEGLKILLLLDTSKPLMPWQSGITCAQRELVADQNEFHSAHSSIS